MYQPTANGAQEGCATSRRASRRGRAARFFRGYLMVAGAVATLYGLALLVVTLLVEIGKWMPAS